MAKLGGLSSSELAQLGEPDPSEADASSSEAGHAGSSEPSEAGHASSSGAGPSQPRKSQSATSGPGEPGPSKPASTTAHSTSSSTSSMSPLTPAPDTTQEGSPELAQLDIQMGDLMSDSILANRASPVPNTSPPGPFATPDPLSTDVDMHTITINQDESECPADDMDTEQNAPGDDDGDSECFLHFSFSPHTP